VTDVEDATFLWLTRNVALDLPAGIVTLAGTLAAELSELARLTLTPPAGAGPESVAVPVTTVEELPFTEVGETLTEIKAAG
jgi:hypothetical protein